MSNYDGELWSKLINIWELFDDNACVIPTYQRPYVWDETNIDRIFDIFLDLINGKEKEVYLGNIHIYANSNNGVNQWQIIDGQQRLTTLSIFISVYLKLINLNQNDKDRIKNLLINENSIDDVYKYKLVVSKNQREVYDKIIQSSLNKTYLSSKNIDCNIYNNFKIFSSLFEKNGLNKRDDLGDFSKLLRKIKISVVNLPKQINSQGIFEALNSTGVPLNEADKIKNFVLMDSSTHEQDILYTKYWEKMEIFLNEKGIKEMRNIDSFFNYFINIKSKTIINRKKVYTVFKEYCKKNNIIDKESKSEFLSEIYDYFLAYKKILENDFENNEFKKAIQNYIVMNQTTANSILIDLIYKKFIKENSSIPERDILDILILINSYIVRKSYFSLENESKNLNRKLGELLKSSNENNIKYEIKNILLNGKGVDIFPNDDVFEDGFIQKQLFNGNKSSKYAFLLKAMESYNKEKHLNNYDGYQVEHILPQTQNLSQEWKNDLGDSWKKVHDKWVYTVGNVTLTKGNQLMSTKPFKIKVSMNDGLIDAHLRINDSIIENKEIWNEERIVNRAKALFNIAKELWPYPR